LGIRDWSHSFGIRSRSGTVLTDRHRSHLSSCGRGFREGAGSFPGSGAGAVSPAGRMFISPAVISSPGEGISLSPWALITGRVKGGLRAGRRLGWADPDVWDITGNLSSRACGGPPGAAILFKDNLRPYSGKHVFFFGSSFQTGYPPLPRWCLKI
jgi:hypothetical protein